MKSTQSICLVQGVSAPRTWHEASRRNAMGARSPEAIMPIRTSGARRCNEAGCSGSLAAVVPAAGRAGRVLRRVYVEARLAAGGTEVVGVAVDERPIFGGGRVDAHSADRVGCRRLLLHVISFARMGIHVGRSGFLSRYLHVRLECRDLARRKGLDSECAQPVCVGYNGQRA